MENVTDRTSNPFGMRAPCTNRVPGRHAAVYGYGDANADFHLIGDHPGVHGGAETGVPFTGTDAGRRLQEVAYACGFAAAPYANEPDLTNLFLSYIHLCTPADGAPSDEDYAELERFFDAELRAINAHILLPVGARATDHVLEEYTTQRHRFELDMLALHGKHIRGRGFLIVPVSDPDEWSEAEDERGRLIDSIQALLASDYRQTKGVATMIG